MYFLIIIKTIILYILVIIIYRLNGKKEINQLNVIDLIIFFLIIQLITISIWTNQSIFISFISIIILIMFQLLFEYITYKNNKIKQFIDGKPIIIIKDGQLNFKEMVKSNYHLEDIIKELNEQGIKRIEDIKLATIDKGKLLIQEMNNEYPMPIILNGYIDYFSLKKIKKDINWINNILDENNLRLDEIFYAFYTKQKTFIIKKD
ncbi:MAG: DUF421 domain-containing protein [Mollicutes bacterium]|nr:DUF421 domain-containing protein [Mollicutes bacterium]